LGGRGQPAISKRRGRLLGSSGRQAGNSSSVPTSVRITFCGVTRIAVESKMSIVSPNFPTTHADVVNADLLAFIEG